MMAVILGIDLGTSSVKAMLAQDTGAVIDTASCEYAVNFLADGGAEQDADMWWEQTCRALHALRVRNPSAYAGIKAIGLTGQMHGLVCLNNAHKPLRPAMIWMDNRACDQAKRICDTLGEEKIASTLHNRPYPGFAFPSLLWVRDNEPDVFAKTASVLLPKDYIRLKLTGELGSDFSDASSTTVFDLGKRDWSFEILDTFGIPARLFPKVGEGSDIAGALSAPCAAKTGLPAGIPVVYGAGDQPAQSLGNGSAISGLLSSSIGTSGQLATYSPEDTHDPLMRVHTFNHAVNRAYTVYGAMLCAGASLKWLKNQVLRISAYSELDAMASRVACGSEGLLFLPYLNGERTPHMDASARGVFFGLTMRHEDAHMVRAVMEGVCFALKNASDIFDKMGLSAKRVIASGGGAQSELWLQMQASILEKEVAVCTIAEQAALGACILASIGAGLYPGVERACGAFVRYDGKIYTPITAQTQRYRELYPIYNALYKQNQTLFAQLH